MKEGILPIYFSLIFSDQRRAQHMPRDLYTECKSWYFDEWMKQNILGKKGNSVKYSSAVQ